MPWERNWPDRPTSASASVQKIDHASRRGSLVPTESRMDGGGENQVDTLEDLKVEKYAIDQPGKTVLMHQNPF